MLKPLILDEWEYIEFPIPKIVWGFFFIEDLEHYPIEDCVNFKWTNVIFNANDPFCLIKEYELNIDFNNKLFSQEKPFCLKGTIEDWLITNDLCIFYKTNLHEFYHGQQYVKTSQETFKDIKKLLTLME